MKVRILYFASFRDAAGKAAEERELPEGTRVIDLWETLAREIPAFSRYQKMPVAAVAFVADDPHENADRAVGGADFRDERGDVDRLAGQVHQPPATGGR